MTLGDLHKAFIIDITHDRTHSPCHKALALKIRLRSPFYLTGDTRKIFVSNIIFKSRPRSTSLTRRAS